MDVLGDVASAVGAAFGPHPWLPVLIVVALVVLQLPMLGRRPDSRQRDAWRGFKHGARAAVMDRAGGRCEGSAFLFWGRCGEPAVEVDHVVPWSRGGPTVVSNGQALCKAHNRRKGAWMPSWWYVLGLERRRRSYFPVGADVRVHAVMSDLERRLRQRPAAQRAV